MSSQALKHLTDVNRMTRCHYCKIQVPEAQNGVGMQEAGSLAGRRPAEEHPLASHVFQEGRSSPDDSRQQCKLCAFGKVMLSSLARDWNLASRSPDPINVA
jgi:hypothetical protein